MLSDAWKALAAAATSCGPSLTFGTIAIAAAHTLASTADTMPLAQLLPITAAMKRWRALAAVFATDDAENSSCNVPCVNKKQ